MPSSYRHSVGWCAAFGVLLIWSAWVVISRLGVQQTLTIYDMTALRILVASLAVLPLAIRHWPTALAPWKVGLLSLGPGVPYALFAFAGMQYAPASHAGIMMNGALPIFAAVLGWAWLHDRPGLWKCLGMAVILSGCAVIAFSPDPHQDAESAWIGDLLFLGAALTFSGYLTATKRWGVAPLQAMVSIPIVNLAWFGPVYLLFLPKSVAAAPICEILLQGLYQGLGPGIFGVLCFTTAVRSIGPMSTAAVLTGVPALAAVVAIPTLGEWPDAPIWGGIALDTCGILLAAGWRPAWRLRRVVGPAAPADLATPSGAGRLP